MDQSVVSFQGKKNIYTCRKCGDHVVTIDRDKGVTPFIIKCEKCNDYTMQSSMYRVFDQNIRPSHEWYAPDKDSKEYLKYFDHCSRGGLLLRRKGLT